MPRIGRIPLRKRVRMLEMDYYIAQKDIQKALLSINVANYSELAAADIRKKIDMQIRQLNRKAIRWAKESVPMAYRDSYLISKTRLEILGAKKSLYFNAKKHRNSIDEYIDKTMDDLIKANQSIKMNVAMYLYLVRQAIKGLMQIQAFDIREEAFIADLLDEELRAGATRGHAQRLIMEHLKIQALDGQFIQIHGRNYNMRKYADLVAKTRLRHVQTEAVLNSCKEYENDLVEVSDHGCDCNICLPYEGNIYSLSGSHPTYPFLDSYPPWHPRCQHNISPTSEVALEWRERYA